MKRVLRAVAFRLFLAVLMAVSYLAVSTVAGRHERVPLSVDAGQVQLQERREAFDVARFDVLRHHQCRGGGSPKWYHDHKQYPNVMIGYRWGEQDMVGEPLRFDVRPWSFDNLRGWVVMAVCDR